MTLFENNAAAYDALLWYAQMGVSLCVEDIPQKIVASKKEVISDQRSGISDDATGAAPPFPLRENAGVKGVDSGAFLPDAMLLNPEPRIANPKSPALAATPTSIAAAVAEARAWPMPPRIYPRSKPPCAPLMAAA